METIVREMDVLISVCWKENEVSVFTHLDHLLLVMFQTLTILGLNQ
jgi:hypothetical protein